MFICGAINHWTKTKPQVVSLIVDQLRQVKDTQEKQGPDGAGLGQSWTLHTTLHTTHCITHCTLHPTH